jgi:hypothetical protein
VFSCPIINLLSSNSASNDIDDKINWGWVCATITSDFHPNHDGSINASSSMQILVTDESSEFHGRSMEIPGHEIENHVVMANRHGGEEDMGEVSFDEGCGYPSDLITLTHLHEPAVVHCLRMRYERDEIYTATGESLMNWDRWKIKMHCVYSNMSLINVVT